MSDTLAKEIKNEKDIEFLLSLNQNNINRTIIMESFGDFGSSKRFDPYDVFAVPPNSYGVNGMKNENSFNTTVGLWMFNRLVIEKNLFDIFGYINHNVNGDELEKINDDLSYALLENKIEVDDLKEFLMCTQFLMRFVSILSPNHTMKMLKSSQYIAKEKNKLVKQYEKELKAGDEITAAKIEKQLIDISKEYLKGDPSMDMYDSKAKGKFDNNFKNMFIMKGAIMNPNPDKGFDITTSNYMDGIKKEEYATFANSLVGGAYAKAKNTQLGGYWVKLFLSAFQHIVLDPAESDCGTKKFIEVELTDKNIADYMYCYVISGSKLIEITSENRKSFIGKKVKMRFGSMCESKTGICNHCAGNLYYRLGIKNIGMTTTKLPSRVMNLSLKKFHDSSIRIIEMDPMVAFGIKK